MALKRKPMQGVLNIIRFNRHFYLMAFVVLIVLILIKNCFSQPVQFMLNIGIACAIFTLVISLFVSFYVYDVSNLYQLKWIKNADNKKILNINAGFDETSEIIINKFSETDLTICDFYNPNKHTEISIKRARKAYPPNEKTILVSTEKLPFSDNAFDKSLAILSAHEIRNKNERVRFFKELNRVTKEQIFVTEHLRDFTNFMAYSIGIFHFHSRQSWLQTFKQANLTVTQEIKTPPFITTFVLEKNGNPL
jgi:ubiquinone/menaquinone biosynthesis C-methylase UbiE